MTAAGFGRSRFHTGMLPSELWGIQTREPGVRKRGDAARARRRLKQAAKRQGVRLKWFLRENKS